MKHKYKGMLVEQDKSTLNLFLTGFKEIEPIFNRKGCWKYTLKNGYSWVEKDGKAYTKKYTYSSIEKQIRKDKIKSIMFSHMCFSKLELEAIKTIAYSNLPYNKEYMKILQGIRVISESTKHHLKKLMYKNWRSKNKL